MVAQISPVQGYFQLLIVISITSVAWQIPKSMIIVNTIDKCISISTNYCNGVFSAMAKYLRMIIRPFHASLVVSIQEEHIDTFRNGETRDLICTGLYHVTRDNGIIGTEELYTDASGMGVDNSDIEVVLQ